MNWEKYLELKKARLQSTQRFIPENENEAKQALALGIIGMGEYVEFSLTMEPLVDSVHDPDPEIRKQAVQQIAVNPTPFSIRLLHFMLNDSDEEVRLYASTELDRIDGEMQNQIFLLEEALKKNARQPELRLQLAKITIDYARLMMIGKNLQRFFLKKAIRLLDENIASDEQNAENYFYRGWALEMIGDFRAALRDLNTALKLNPKESRAYVEMAQIYFTAGKFDWVRRLLDKAPIRQEEIEPFFTKKFWSEHEPIS